MIAVAVQALLYDAHGCAVLQQRPDEIIVIYARSVSDRLVQAARFGNFSRPEQEEMSQVMRSLFERYQINVVRAARSRRQGSEFVDSVSGEAGETGRDDVAVEREAFLDCIRSQPVVRQ